MLAAFVAGTAWAAQGSPPPGALTLAVIPQAPPGVMHERWSPLAERLSKAVGIPIRLKLYDDVIALERDLLEGTPDLVYTHPAMFAAAHQKHGYIPLVRDQTQLAAVVFVRKDSPIKTVKELQGKQVAFVGGRNYCAVLIQRAMKDADVWFLSQNVGSVRNVLRSVMVGKADAGVTLDASFVGEPDEMRADLRPILELPKAASHPFGAHPRVPRQVREQLKAALLKMASEPDAGAILASANLPRPEAADYERDYRYLEMRE
jgi:phosphonate transport system substrate-binding protein